MSRVRVSTMVAVGAAAAVLGYCIGARSIAEKPLADLPYSSGTKHIADSASTKKEVGELIDRSEESDVANYAFREAEFLAKMIATGDDGERTNGIGETYSILPSLFKAWARREPEAALAAVIGLGSDQRYRALEAVFEPIFEIDSDRGLALYEGLPSELQDIDLELGWIVHFMADASPTKAVEWMFGRMEVHQVPIEKRWDRMVRHGVFDDLDGEGRMECFRRAEALGWNPEFSAQWLSDDSAIHNQMAREDPGAALTWLRENAKWAFVNYETSRNPDLFYGAGERFAEAVLTHGISVAEEIWGRLEPGAFRTSFAIGLALKKAAFDPERAARWVAGIGDVEEQYFVGRRLLGSWEEMDPSGVENYLRAAREDVKSWLPASAPHR